MSDKDILNSLRRDILDAGYISKEGHIPSAYSILEIVYGFYKNLNKNKLIGVDEINLDKIFGTGTSNYSCLWNNVMIYNRELTNDEIQINFEEENLNSGGAIRYNVQRTLQQHFEKNGKCALNGNN